MGEPRPIEERISQAERRWPGLVFKQTGNEAHSACPFCRGGKDRFMIFEHGSYWCRACDSTGWIDENNPKPLTEADRTEIRLQRLEYQQAKTEQRLSALERMHACTDHLRYFHNMEIHTDAIEYWDSQGISLQTMDDYLLGYCPRCPTDHDRRASYTIPVMASGKLWNIRHRLIGAPDSDKYRPHIAGLPSMLFNADYLNHESATITIVEGEKKSIVLAQMGFPNVGLMGKSGFQAEWASKFNDFRAVFVALDPDAEAQAVEIAKQFKERGRVVQLPGKIDDLIVKYGAKVDDIEAYLRMARPI